MGALSLAPSCGEVVSALYQPTQEPPGAAKMMLPDVPSYSGTEPPYSLSPLGPFPQPTQTLASTESSWTCGSNVSAPADPWAALAHMKSLLLQPCADSWELSPFALRRPKTDEVYLLL